ncbi:MAG: right-handed parallel beta-helix repeat-containing protein, partial [Thermoplasmata archaeon]
MIPHSPIFIDGDGDFNIGNGVVAGNGTPENPYIIENWYIRPENSEGIYIRNVTFSHFIIRNVYIDGRENKGIILENIFSNNTIEKTTIFNCSIGIKLHCTNRTFIKDCAIYSCQFGINAYLPPNSWIYKNIIRECENGIYLSGNLFSSHNVIISENLIQFCNIGIWRGAGVSTSIIYMNQIEFCDVGILLSSGGYMWSHSEVYENNIFKNRVGIFGGACQFCGDNITRNIIAYSQSYGISLCGYCMFERIWNNTFWFNNNGGCQAYDEGEYNEWYNGSYGNYWSDWVTPDENGDGIVDNPYIIDTKNDSQYHRVDPYPLAKLPSILIFHEPPLYGEPGTTIDITARVVSQEPIVKVCLYYKLTNETTWLMKTMALSQGNATDGNYTATLEMPLFQAGMDYYIKAVDCLCLNVSTPIFTILNFMI